MHEEINYTLNFTFTGILKWIYTNPVLKNLSTNLAQTSLFYFLFFYHTSLHIMFVGVRECPAKRIIVAAISRIKYLQQLGNIFLFMFK